MRMSSLAKIVMGRAIFNQPRINQTENTITLLLVLLTHVGGVVTNPSLGHLQLYLINMSSLQNWYFTFSGLQISPLNFFTATMIYI